MRMACCSVLLPLLLAYVLAGAVDANGYFRFTPENEQWVVLFEGVSNGTTTVGFNQQAISLRKVQVYINGSDTVASWSQIESSSRPFNLAFSSSLDPTSVSSLFALTTMGSMVSLSIIDMEGPLLRPLLNSSACFYFTPSQQAILVCPLRLPITVTSTTADEQAGYDILVLLGDVDEFPPVLSPSSTQFTVSEDTPVGTVLVSFDSQEPALNHSGNINVTDNDFLPRNTFSFSQSSSTLFSFNSTHGVLRIRSPLSTLEPVYPVTCEPDVCFMVLQFRVSGIETGGSFPVMETTFTATITIQPLPRYIELTPNTSSAEVSEAVTVGTVLVSFNPLSVQGLVNVAVNASSKQLELSFTDSAVATSGYFSLSDITKTLSLQRPLDLDVPLPPFLANCSMPPCVAKIGVQVGVYRAEVSAEFSLSLSVTALNEFVPTFSNAPYSGTVIEHHPVGTPVLEVECTDEDRFSDLKVSIISWDPSQLPLPFNLSGSTLLVAGLVDYETVPVYHLRLSCSDGEKESFTDVEVTVRNINDNSPVFDRLVYNFRMPSSVVFPLSFGTVHATDLDGDPVTYSLLHNLTIFTVSPAGGEVASLEEVTRAYTLTVVAVDSGTPSRTGSALIEVEGDSPVAPLIQGGSSNSVDLGVSISLGVGGFMILVGIIISIMVPVCVLKYIQQHGELRIATDTEALLPAQRSNPGSPTPSRPTSTSPSPAPQERAHDSIPSPEPGSSPAPQERAHDSIPSPEPGSSPAPQERAHDSIPSPEPACSPAPQERAHDSIPSPEPGSSSAPQERIRNLSGTLADDYSNVPGERIELQARSFTACRQIEREVDPQQGVGLGGSSSSGRCQIDTVKRPHSYVSVTLNSEEGTTV